ncbi:MAG: hypothetical protein NTW29_06500 [Bacteroidetes bacterium]|nr:hypothetical protein [Bacteroidota bacterium]
MQKQIEKFLLLTVMLTLFFAPGFAQPTNTQKRPFKKKNVIWFTPNVANQINGIAAGFQAMNVADDSLTINGVNASLGFLGFMALPYVLHEELSSKKNKTPGFMEVDTALTVINGISASMGGEFAVSVNGINMTFGFTSAAQLNGISVSGLFTRCHSFKGICISGFRNNAKKGTGIQISLFNKCEKLKGIQIGLWNKSGKRGLPLLNWGI